jgi:multiple sugar transport system permease protein
VTTRWRIGLPLLAPAVILVFGLVAYPIVYDVSVALTDTRGFAGFSNFGALINEAEFWRAARNSLIYTVLTASVRLLLGVSMALALWRMRRGRVVVFLALFVAWIFPATLSAFAFYWLLSPPFHTFYTLTLLQLRWALAGLVGEDIWQVASVALHDVWRSSAFVAIFLLAGLNSLSTDQLDYARLECKSSWRRFWLVIVPMMRRFLVLSLLLSVVMSFIDYTGTYIEMGGRVTWPLIGTLAYQESFLNGHISLGSAMTLIQLPVWMVVLWIGFRLFERKVDMPPAPEPISTAAAWSRRAWAPVPQADQLTQWGEALHSEIDRFFDPELRSPTPGRKRRIWRRHHLRPLTSAASGLAISAFAIFPVWWIFLQAVRPISEDRLGNPFWTWAPTLDGFTSALHGRLVGVWLLNTFIVLGFGIAITLVVSALAGYALGRLRVPAARWIARALFATYFLPFPMLLIPVYQIFQRLGLDNTLLAVILLNQTLTIPFATWLCFSYFDALPADVEEHARLDASNWAVLRRIVLPMSWPVLIASGVFAAGIMASDVVYAGLLLVHDNVKTVAVGLGLIGISLDEFDTISGGIGMAAAPLVLVCAAFAPAYVRGLSAAMVEGA